MKKEEKRRIYTAVALFTGFVAWTVALCLVDVQPIGPRGSMVGLATLNRWVHEGVGVHLSLYVITDWLSLIPLAMVIAFAFKGLVQWIKRKRLQSVDRDLLLLGGFYLTVFALYLLFEYLVINYRPILIEGVLEPSYPSSTTVLVLCVISGAIIHLKQRMRQGWHKRCILILLGAFAAFMVVARLLSGVHWVTDIIGGILLGAALVWTYYFLSLHKKQ